MRADSSAGGGRAVQAIDLMSGCLITQTSDSRVAYSPLVKDARAERLESDLAHGSPLDGVEVGAGGSEPEGTFPAYPCRVSHRAALSGARRNSRPQRRACLLLPYEPVSDRVSQRLGGSDDVLPPQRVPDHDAASPGIRGHRPPLVAAFYVRRVFRIFPLYFFVLGVHYVLIVQAGSGRTLRSSRRRCRGTSRT